MAYLLYKYLRREGSRPCEPREHERPMSQSSGSPLELSYLPGARRGADSGIEEISSGQPIVEKPHNQAASERKTVDPSVICDQDKKAASRYRWKLIAGLCLPFSVQALDATIIASALPFIASDFRKSAKITEFLNR